ncbi:MAG: hypothetical protein ACM3PV_07580 [Betaproteobacteria bacterium]
MRMLDLDQLREIAATPWRPVSFTAFAAGLVTLVALAVAVGRGEGWVPLLDSVNLAFHEAGHPLVGLFSTRLEPYGGTLFQLGIPCLVIASFWLRRDALGASLATGWLAENLHNVARYMADARAQVLPLVGGGEHDWFHIFIRWNLLGSDTRIAACVRALGWAGLLASSGWLAWRWRQTSQARSPAPAAPHRSAASRPTARRARR